MHPWKHVRGCWESHEKTASCDLTFMRISVRLFDVNARWWRNQIAWLKLHLAITQTKKRLTVRQTWFAMIWPQCQLLFNSPRRPHRRSKIQEIRLCVRDLPVLQLGKRKEVSHSYIWSLHLNSIWKWQRDNYSHQKDCLFIQGIKTTKTWHFQSLD